MTRFAPNETLVHGTCVALGSRCVLLRGAPGAGKSDLALRFLFLPIEALGARPALVADDQVLFRRNGEGGVIASCPPSLAGKIEVRGLGIAELPGRIAENAGLWLVADLDDVLDQPRYPGNAQWETILGVAIRRIALNPFEPSAPVKLALALQDRFVKSGD